MSGEDGRSETEKFENDGRPEWIPAIDLSRVNLLRFGNI